MSPVDGPRLGLLGRWDRLVGPGATVMENVGTIGLAAVGAFLALRSTSRAPASPEASTGARRLSVLLMAVDLWGGAWCNNTPSAAHWYERDGQGPRDHLAFAAAHVHPFVLAWLDRGHHGPRRWSVWGAAHYGYQMLATTTVVSRRDRRSRRVLSIIATAGALALDRSLGRSPNAPWFAPVYHLKLLAGHAAGAAASPHRRSA